MRSGEVCNDVGRLGNLITFITTNEETALAFTILTMQFVIFLRSMNNVVFILLLVLFIYFFF